jgi:two-component system, cell cycle sensor histidine kinase and response regulator CckA
MTEQKTNTSDTGSRAVPLIDETSQLALSIDRMPLGYIVWSAQYRVLEWNPAAEKIFGWSLAEARGKCVNELMMPGADLPPDCMRRASEQGSKTVETVCAGVNKRGKRVVCEWHNTPVRNAGGALTGMISMVNDITDRDQTNRELRESRKFLQTIIDSEPECVKLLDAKAALVMMNRAGLDMIQAESLEQVKGQCICPLVSAEHAPAFMKLTEEVFEGGSGSLTFEMTGLRGRKLWLETHAVPLRNDKDEIIALLGITRDVSERIKTEEILKQERDFTNAVLETVRSMVLVLDRDGRVIRFNRMCEEVSGYSAEEVLGKFLWDLLIPPEQVAEVKGVFSRLQAGMFPNRHENYWVAKDGTRKLIAWSTTALLAADGSVEFVLPTGTDMSERKRLEDQLRQSQKMESIGTLAGGIAHDFNNILTAIIGYASLLQMKMREQDPLRHSVDQILSSANRAATLTQGLLAYSRKQILNAQPLNINEIIRKVELLLRRLIGEDIELRTLLTDQEVTVLADAGQIEQVLMNLATNARDAMPDGGNLYIETEQEVVDEHSASTHEISKPGVYAVISVTDSGIGMDEKTRDRIFDPFFTTKEVGKGTGLGLAMAYGIVKQHNGAIVVSTELGRGSTFKIYLPVVPVEQKHALSVDLPAILGGSETILLAEDDQVVRELTSHVLQQFGYRVIEAVDGEDAVNKYMQNRGAVKLLLLDVIMPKKNGKEVYSKIVIFEPGIKALFLSGYTADIMQQKGLIEPGFNFIMKPVPVNELLRRIRSLLDGISR